MTERYIPESWSDVGFEFTTGGYTAPTSSGISFSFLRTLSDVMNIGATISGAEPATYQEYTYTELRNRNVYALAFGSSGWQILKGRIDYSGIRDLGARVTLVDFYSDIKDLMAVIIGAISEETDLPAFLRATFRESLDLSAVTRAVIASYSDLTGILHGWGTRDLGGYLVSMYPFDLGALLEVNLSVDLAALIRIYYHKDIPAYISGWAVKDLGAYLTTKGRAWLDLNAYLNDIHFKNLRGILRGFAVGVIKDLHAYINDIHWIELPGYIFGREKKDLRGIIFAIAHKNLPGWIHPWHVLDLGGSIFGDLPIHLDLLATILAISHSNLTGILSGWAVRNLPAYVGVSRNFLDLSALLSGFNLGVYTKDLNAVLTVRGQSFNLGASIIPRLVKFVTMLSIDTMEYLDLSGVLNIAPCWNFRLVDLSGYLYPIYKKDLYATIYGWKYSDYYRNLNARINTAMALFEKAVDDLTIIYEFKDKVAVDDLTIEMWDTTHSLDDLTVYYKIGGGYGVARDLVSYINGLMHTFDLSARIAGVIEAPYIPGGIFGPYSDATIFTAPYILNNTVLWERVVQISFLSGVYDYFYQSATDTLWKVGSDKWVIDVSSWREETENIQDKSDLRKKYVFNLSDYESLDEAVRHAIDWVIGYPRIDLNATITAAGSTGIFADLAAMVCSMDKSYTDVKTLNARITPTP